MATIYWPNPVRGSTRPYGYWEQQTQVGAGSKIIGVHSDVHKIGVQVDVVSPGEYFVEGTMNSPEQIIAETAVWYDLYGNQITAQNSNLQFPLDGQLTAIRLRVISGTMTITVDERRV